MSLRHAVRSVPETAVRSFRLTMTMGVLRQQAVQPLLACFPESYSQAREQFLEAAQRVGCATSSWPIPEKGPRGESLAVDVAIFGDNRARRWILITSGLHGTEGPLGSAVQLGWLRRLQNSASDNMGIVMLHALNPYGFAWIRRANENNVDLNRNFLLPGESYQGAHPLYHHVYQAFDPHRRKRLYANFYLSAGWLIARHTRAALQTSLPIGQYEYPQGLFFGGHGPSQLQMMLQERLPGLIPNAGEVTHLDFHTGLGRWSHYRLLIDVDDQHQDAEWFRSWSPANTVEAASTARTSYLARGSIGPWMKQVAFPHAHYRYAGAEFGTYSQVRVLHALVEELRTHYACEPDHPAQQRAKHRLKETFVPRSSRWREASLLRALDLCERTARAMQ